VIVLYRVVPDFEIELKKVNVNILLLVPEILLGSVQCQAAEVTSELVMAVLPQCLVQGLYDDQPSDVLLEHD
jgi:hypothetical protein